MTLEDEDEGDDELARALGRRARDTPEPRPWEAVLRGEAELEAVAAAHEVELERARAYFTPLEPERVAAIVDAILPPVQAEAVTVPEAGEVVDLASRRRDRSATWIVIGSVLALAAALALWWTWPRGEPGDRGGVASHERLPSYGLEVGGWLKELRAPEPDAPAPTRYRYALDGEFEWVLRPDASVTGELTLRAYVLDEGQARALELGAMVEIAASGAVRVEGTIDRLNLGPGSHTIVLVVGRPDKLPEAAQVVAEPSAEQAWRTHRIDLELIP